MSAALLLAGCGGGGGGDGTTIDHTVVETGIETGIAQQQHRASVVSCPKDVKAKTGRTFTCTATLMSGDQHPVTVTVTAADGSVHYEGLNGFVGGRPPK
jgi:hypothetical protein